MGKIWKHLWGLAGISLLVMSMPLFSQETESEAIQPPATPKPKIDSTVVKYFNHSFDSLALGYLHVVDTSLLYVSRFDPIAEEPAINQTLSNAGLAHQPLLFSPVFNDGFAMDFHPFAAFIQNSSTINYIVPTAALTELNYMMGSKKEQQLKVRFGREVAPRWFVGMNFGLLNSPGPYKNNATNNTNVSFTLRYNTKNHRYGVLGNYFNSKLVMNENGGIVDDDEFENDVEFDRRVIAVHLETAKNRYKQSGFGFEQYFILLPELKKETDSTQTQRKFQIGRLTHQFEYQRNQAVYSEDNPLVDFYQPFDVVLDSSNTYDSIYQSVVRNRIQWSNLGYKNYNKDIGFHLTAGLEFANIQNSDSLVTQKYWQVNPYGHLSMSLFKSFYLNGTAKLITGTTAAGDFELFGKLRQYLGTDSRNLGNLFFSVRLLNQQPAWFYERYQSNHFRWDQTLVKSQYLTFAGGYTFKTFEAGAEWNLLDKHIYLDENAHARQTSGTIKVFRLYSNFHLNPGKFDIIGNVNYQLSDNDTLVKLPELSARLRVAFHQQLFKNAATFQTGFEAVWFSAYYADAYMPALRAFYLQNDKQIGDYPFIDVFIGLKVKRARIFVKYANLFGLTGDYSYYASPHYPARDPRLYFGVSWRFYQ